MSMLRYSNIDDLQDEFGSEFKLEFLEENEEDF